MESVSLQLIPTDESIKLLVETFGVTNEKVQEEFRRHHGVEASVEG